MKTSLFMTLAVATFALAGCSNDDSENQADWNGEIRLSSGVTVLQTRGDNTPPDTQIANGQEVGVFISDAEDAAIGTDLKYTADGSGGLTLAVMDPEQDTPYYPANGNSVNIYAYQPYSTTATADVSYDFSVQTDQSIAGNNNYYDSDLLYSATKVYSRQAAPLSLAFEHKLSKVVCTLVAGTGEPDLTGATVAIVNVETKGTFNPSDGTFTTTTSGAVQSDVTMNSTITSGSYIAVIPPQTFTKGAQFLKVTVADGGTFYHKIPNGNSDSDLILAAGNVYTYTITVNKTGLTVTSTISPWEGIESNKKTGTAEME